MGAKKPERYVANRKALLALCKDRGYEYEEFEYMVRVYSGAIIADVYPSRMRASISSIDGVEPSRRQWITLDFEFNAQQVDKYLLLGKIPKTFINCYQWKESN